MRVFVRFVAGLLLLLMAPPAGATSVVAPAFQELVSRAERVIVAEVIDTESRRVISPSGPVIVTAVTFRIDRTLKGEPQLTTILEFMGGTVGDEHLEVTGMPTFRIGDRDSGREGINGDVAARYGQFHCSPSVMLPRSV